MAHTALPGPAASGISPSDRPPRPSAEHRPETSPPVTAADRSSLGLPQVFSPLQAAEILRRLGLAEMTECALRTRAYRRQIPFHLNGRRIRFTAADLREIIEGNAQRPGSTSPARTAAQAAPTRQASRRSPARTADRAPVTWRARGSLGKPTTGRESPR
jgi:hypothetical protein